MVRILKEEIEIKTKKIYDFVDLTQKIQKIVENSNIKDGILILNNLHNTASLLIQEKDNQIFNDLKNSLEKIFPLSGKYEHDYEGNVNATAHLKSSLFAPSITLSIRNGKLDLGTWQSILFVEFFEPRERKIIVTIIGE